MFIETRERRHCTMRSACQARSFIALALVSMTFIASCASPSTTLAPALDLSTLKIDLLKFEAIALRPDIGVKATVLGAVAATPGARWYVLEYQERENRKGYVPEREAEYVNLFLANQVERIGAGHDVSRNRYLVVELWHYDPARGIKTCHQWIIWDDDPEGRPTRVSFRFLIEDFHNVLLGERSVPLDSHTVERLGNFYVKARRFLLDRIRERPGHLTHPL